ncbi:MAG: hypothetical protein AB1465_06950 [Patescibacteria group bacterium]
MRNVSKISNEMQQLKGGAAMVALIIVLVILAMAASGAAVYFWQKSKSVTKTQTGLESPRLTPTPSPTTTQPTATSTKTPTPTPTKTPTEVVEIFMKATLGTLPGAKIDYDFAKNLMTDDLKAKHTGEGWVPQFYGIQDGPVSIKFISQNTVGDNAYVRFDPSWGEMSLGWLFTLKKVGNNWLIDDFRNDVQ